MKDKIETLSSPRAVATSASEKPLFSMRSYATVVRGETTSAPLGAFRVIPVNSVSAEVSTALTFKFPAVAESVVTTIGAVVFVVSSE